IFLLDEPGQYLDPEKRILVRELIQKLVQKNKTVLIVEHGANWFGQTDKKIELYVEKDTLKGREV
ncbi:MAG: ABC transporter ATP-binding protein, partial [Bacteriovoracaceae bacterium]